MAQKDRSFFRKFKKCCSKSYFKSCHWSKIVKNEFLIIEIPIFFGLIALEMIFSKFVKKWAAILSHFLFWDQFKMVKFEFCIIKTIMIPIEFFLLALEMNFSHFWKTRAFFLKNRHFQSFPVISKAHFHSKPRDLARWQFTFPWPLKPSE